MLILINFSIFRLSLRYKLKERLSVNLSIVHNKFPRNTRMLLRNIWLVRFSLLNRNYRSVILQWFGAPPDFVPIKETLHFCNTKFTTRTCPSMEICVLILTRATNILSLLCTILDILKSNDRAKYVKYSVRLGY